MKNRRRKQKRASAAQYAIPPTAEDRGANTDGGGIAGLEKEINELVNNEFYPAALARNPISWHRYAV